MHYLANQHRYDKMEYRRCGNSGLKLPALSLGLWHNFGHIDVLENARNILRTAFDNGITHFDLAITTAHRRVLPKKTLARLSRKTFFRIGMN